MGVVVAKRVNIGRVLLPPKLKERGNGMKSILIDDLRQITATVVCRDPISAFKALEESTFDEYIFDHDLGYTAPGSSGYDILKWALAQGRINLNARIILVTDNVIGRQRMENLLRDHGFSRNLFYWRIK